MKFHLPHNHSLGPGSQLTSSFFKTGALPKRSVDRFSHQNVGESYLMWWPSKQEYIKYRLCFYHISLYPSYIGWFITSYNHQFYGLFSASGHSQSFSWGSELIPTHPIWGTAHPNLPMRLIGCWTPPVILGLGVQNLVDFNWSSNGKK